MQSTAPALVAAALCVLGTACASRPATPPHLTSADVAFRTVRTTSPWAQYDEAVVDARRGDVDAALGHYRLAEERFGDAHPRHRARAIYGRARVLDRAGRCGEAGAAYEAYARAVQGSDPAGAAMARGVGLRCYTPFAVNPTLGAATAAIVAGRDEEALLQLDAQPGSAGATASPWLAYDRAVALQALRRTDEAVAAYEVAEVGFTEAEPNQRGKLLAVYGRARALVDGYRCKEARTAYDEYATLLEPTDPDGAKKARTDAGDCK